MNNLALESFELLQQSLRHLRLSVRAGRPHALIEQSHRSDSSCRVVSRYLELGGFVVVDDIRDGSVELDVLFKKVRAVLYDAS